MKIYNYDNTTGDFISTGEADESPLEPGKYIVPAYATTIKPPVFDAVKQRCIFNKVEWVIESRPEPEPVPEQEPTNYKDSNELSLWQACTDYEQRYISGSAIGTLSIGVIQGLPKSVEIKAWISNLWMNHYYPRKATITGDAPLSKEDLDFTLVGPMPYSVPELVEEVGV